jgi:predicted Zn-dependent peptidase
MFAEYKWFETYLDKLASVTVKDVQRVANEYFKPQSRVVGTYVPVDGRMA